MGDRVPSRLPSTGCDQSAAAAADRSPSHQDAMRAQSMETAADSATMAGRNLSNTRRILWMGIVTAGKELKLDGNQSLLDAIVE